MRNYPLLATLFPNCLVLCCILLCPRLLISIVVMVATGMLSLFLPATIFFWWLQECSASSCHYLSSSPSFLGVVSMLWAPLFTHVVPIIFQWFCPGLFLMSDWAVLLQTSYPLLLQANCCIYPLVSGSFTKSHQWCLGIPSQEVPRRNLSTKRTDNRSVPPSL